MLTAKNEIKIKGVTNFHCRLCSPNDSIRERGELATTKHDHTGTNVTYESD